MQAVQKGCNQNFSGDVIYVPNPATLSSYYQSLERVTDQVIATILMFRCCTMVSESKKELLKA